MSYHFKFKALTPEWKSIGKALERALKYCHDIVPPSPPDDEFVAMIVPLFEFFTEHNKFEPTGLDYLKGARKEGKGAFSAIFLVQNENEIPKYFRPTGEMAPHAEEIIKNPPFGQTGKAVFLAELRYDNETEKFKNVINLSCANSLATIAELIKAPPLLSSHLVEKYYSTFVGFYDPFAPIDNEGRLNLSLRKFLTELCRSSEDHCIEKLNESCEELKTINFNAISTEPFLKLANRIYNCLNNIEEKDKAGHTVSLELFRVPVPFPLQDLVHARKKITGAFKGKDDDNDLNLLLIDNKIDKVIKTIKAGEDYKFEKGELISVLFSREWGMPAFRLGMLGRKENRKQNGITPLVLRKEADLKLPEDWQAYKSIQKRETFDCGEFEKWKDKGPDSNNYAHRVYDKVLSAHFVLLDFFLNEENTYLAFDFIRGITKMKRKKGNTSTTWYFITSAVYDSVVKYSQSGLLAEHYESAVVCAGDDPTNPKRQIIFIYKLLTFLNSRLSNFLNQQEKIDDMLLRDKGVCEHWNENSKKCTYAFGEIKCIQDQMPSIIERYLAEFNAVGDMIFSDDRERQVRRTIAETLKGLINQFLWLPEADWPMIQRQMEFVNSKLKGLSGSKNMEFSCSHIKHEIEKRSNIY